MDGKLLKLIRMEADELAISFEKAGLEGKGTPQEVADRREKYFCEFLAKYFPFPYRIVKGNICDSYGRNSNSIDCLVLNPSHPYTIDSTSKLPSVIFSDGVDYAIEIKSDLSNQSEIERALEQIRSVKKLKRKKMGILFENKLTEEQKDYLKTIPCMIVAGKTFADYTKLIESVILYYEKNNVPELEQVDLILINNRMLIYNSRMNSYITINNHLGLAVWEGGNDSLTLFLYEMSLMPHCEPEIGENVLSIYLEGIRPKSFTIFSYNSLDKQGLQKESII
jgi:hypothetical protein